MRQYIPLIVLLKLAVITNGYAQKTIFWEVKDTVNNKTSYLLGTHHLIGASFIDRFAVIGQALKNSSVAIFESIKEGENHIASIGSREKSDSLRIILTPKEYAYLREVMEAGGSNIDLLDKASPEELRAVLGKNVSKKICGAYTQTDSSFQLDNYLEMKAMQYNIERMGLETGNDQLAALEADAKKSGVSWVSVKKEIKFYLKIRKKEKYNASFCNMTTKYMNFELPYDFDKKCPDNAVIRQRNQKWLTPLADQLSSKNCFVVVGFAHLKYDCGLIVELKKRGYVVTPVMLQ